MSVAQLGGRGEWRHKLTFSFMLASSQTSFMNEYQTFSQQAQPNLHVSLVFVPAKVCRDYFLDRRGLTDVPCCEHSPITYTCACFGSWYFNDEELVCV